MFHFVDENTTTWDATLKTSYPTLFDFTKLKLKTSIYYMNAKNQKSLTIY